MQTLIAWCLVLFVPLAALPWSAWLVSRYERGGRWLVACTALALGYGGLTLVMFWLSLFGVVLEAGVIVLVYEAVMLPGWLVWKRSALFNPSPTPCAGSASLTSVSPEARPPEHRKRRGTIQIQSDRREVAIVLAVAAVAAAVLFNSVYWPFSRDDTRGIYDLQAQEIFETRALIPLTGADSLYLAYPAFMPLAYSFTYLASGWHNEYLARVIPALLSLGCLPAAYLLGSMTGGRLVGWAGMVILALTPTFGRWASSGYVDLPMAFLYTLSAVFALRLWSSRHWSDALLAGLMMGLAAWMKNAALIGVGLLTLWLLWGLLKWRVSARLMALALAACMVVAAPWYARNLMGAGFLMPDTAWVGDAQRTVESLMVLVTKPEIYGVAGWLMLAGVVVTAGMVLRLRGDSPGGVLLLLWTLPFFAAWWLFASYDPRFILLFLPLLSVMAGHAVAWTWNVVPRDWQPRVEVAALVVVLVLAAGVMVNSVEYKDELLRNPFMSDAEKHDIVLDGRR